MKQSSHLGQTETRKGYRPHSNQTYFHDQKLGLIGRRKATNITTRFSGLQRIASENICKNSSLLDLGCAEGLISYEFYKKGCSTIHGFDIQQISIDFANKIFSESNINFHFAQSDFSHWQQFEDSNKILKPKYDIVLFLGVYHHILKNHGEKIATNVLRRSLAKAKKYFAIRTSINFEKSLFFESGFVSIEEENMVNNSLRLRAGKLHIFQKKFGKKEND